MANPPPPQIPPESETIPAPSGSSAVAPGPRTWHAGTLVYTFGSLAALFAWLLLGDFSWSMRDRSVGPMAQWYLGSLGVKNTDFALIISSFPALIGLILGPIISVKSDRHRGKWGRRIPFLLVTTPLAALGMVGVAVTPIVAKWAHSQFPAQNELTVTLLCFGGFWAAFEFATIAGQAVFGGLINDVVPTELLGRFYGLFRAVSLIDGIIFNYWIMGKVPSHFTMILLIIGIFYGTAFMLVCLRVKEGQYSPVPSEVAESPAFSAYFRECFSNSYYVVVFVMLMAASLTFAPVNTFAILYAKSLQVDMDVYGKAVALTYAISLLLSYFLGWLSDAFHPLRTAMISMAGYLIVSVWGSLYATTPNSFLIAWVLHGVLSGCYFTTSASLGQRLFPRSKYAQYASAAGIIGGVTYMVVSPLMGLFIDWTGNIYRYTFVMGAALAATALLMSFYVYRKFVQLGGPRNYTPPQYEENQPRTSP